jgi:hypothetical protein
MNHKKQRDRRHLMEEESGNLLREALPREWAIHGYKPDYGIDGTIEIFDPVVGKDGQVRFETLGEHIFFQLKSVEKTSLDHRVAGSYGSILSGGEENYPDLSIDYEAFIYDLEVDELLTVEAMGAALVVVLFVVALDTRTTYMISLTDYIDRVLDREAPDWHTQTKKRIFIPSALVVPGKPSSTLLRLYSGRSKLMHLFNVASVQHHELCFAREAGGMRELAVRYCKRLLALDVWGIGAFWIILAQYHTRLRAWQEFLSGDITAQSRLGFVMSLGQLQESGTPEEEIHRIREELIDQQLLGLWDGLRALGATHEEMVREWGMPTYFGIKGARCDDQQI